MNQKVNIQNENELININRFLRHFELKKNQKLVIESSGDIFLVTSKSDKKKIGNISQLSLEVKEELSNLWGRTSRNYLEFGAPVLSQRAIDENRRIEKNKKRKRLGFAEFNTLRTTDLSLFLSTEEKKQLVTCRDNGQLFLMRTDYNQDGSVERYVYYDFAYNPVKVKNSNYRTIEYC